MSDNQNPNNKPPDQGPFNFNSSRLALVVVSVFILIIIYLFFFNDSSLQNNISYTEFKNMVSNGQIRSASITLDGTIYGEQTSGESYQTVMPFEDPQLMSSLVENGVEVEGERPNEGLGILLSFLPWIIMFAVIFFMFRQIQGGGNKAFSFGKSRAKKYLDKGKKITFKDVAGHHEAKAELVEVVEFLKNPDKFIKIGARIPKGVLLVGSPGTGKTLLAKAIAGEANVSFFHMSGSDFVEMFVGVGASRVRDLFEQGRKNAPCILFIDELDAVGRTRGAGYGGGHDEREQTLNQMLVEMDGFDTKDGVIIIAATNRPDVLDPALLRPGRFDRQVVVDLPDVKEREAILKIHGAKVPLDQDVDFERIARATPGSSGADLANLVNEAALFAARENQRKVCMTHFEEARDKMFFGLARRTKVIDEDDKKATAYHEAGHTLLHYYLKNADPLHKVTIIPRGRALGMAISLPEKDQLSHNKSWLLDRIRIMMGGYVAEELIYKETTTGASNDIKQATGLARKMVCEFGMSDLGPLRFGDDDQPIFLGKEIARHKDYSELTAQKIDEEMHKIINKALDDVRKLLKSHKDDLETLTVALVKNETMSDQQIRELLGFKDDQGKVASVMVEK